MKKTWAAFAGILAAATLQNATADWSIETVDNSANSGWACSLAVSPSTGRPYISYRRPNESVATFSDVWYATKNGSTWALESVAPSLSTTSAGNSTSIALTELDTPAVTFTTSGTTLNYSIRSGGVWSSAATVSASAGAYSSLMWAGTEAAPNPVVTYQDGTAADLKRALFSGSWVSQTLQSTGSAGAYCSIAKYNTASGKYAGVVFIKDGKLGYQESTSDGSTWAENAANSFAPFSNPGIVATNCALAVAPSKKSVSAFSRHVIFYDSTTGGYYYTTTDTNDSLWMAPQLIAQSGANAVGYYGASIAVGTDGIVRAAYLDYGTKALKYAELKNGAWTSQTVDSTPSGAYCSLRLDSQNQPHIAYTAFIDNATMSYPPAGLKYAEIPGSVAPGGGGGSTTVPLSFAIKGKKKIHTAKSKVVVKGTASASAVSIQWKVGKKKFKKTVVASGQWKAKVSIPTSGKNVVKFQALSATGAATAVQKLTITRDQ